MDLPTYTLNPDTQALAQENYHQEMNQTLRQNLGANGFWVSNITTADLTTTPILDPNLGTMTTVMDLAPVGAIWFVTDVPVWVGKLSAGPTVLQQFTTSNWP